MFDRMGLRTRLWLGFGAGLLMLALVAIVGEVAIARINATNHALVTERYAKAKIAQEMMLAAVANGRTLRGLALTPESAHEPLWEELKRNRAILNTGLADLERLAANDEERKHVKDIEGPKAKVDTLMDELPAMVRGGDKAKLATFLMGDFAAANAEFRKEVKDVSDVEAGLMTAETLAAERTGSAAGTTVLVLGIVALATTIFMGVAVSRSIQRQIGGEPAYAAEVANRVAKGELNFDVINAGASDSVLGSMQTMQKSLRKLVGDMHGCVHQLTRSAGELTGASEQVSTATSAQSDAASSMAAAVEELAVGVAHLADSSRQAGAIAESSSASLTQGVQAVDTSVTAMRNIAGTVNQTADNIRTLGERSKEINTIVGVIKDIAEQTNLLALNAAIEAARAGEQGRGFAVVADEVRKLAERTTQSTRQITETIASIHSGTQDAVTSMSASSVEVAAGLERAGEAMQSMERIKVSTGTILSALQDVAGSLEEQRGASDQIAKSVERVAGMAEENSASVRAVTGAVQHLNQLAVQIDSLVSHFKV